MRLFLFIASLRAGGAERVMSILANAWAAGGHDVTLCTLSGERPFYALDAGVALRPLGLEGASRGRRDAIRANARRLTTIRREIRAARPDAVVAFMGRTNVLALLASRGFGVPVVVSERIHPDHVDGGALEARVRAAAYRLASKVVVQTDEIARAMPSGLRDRLAVIPNPVPDYPLVDAPRAKRVVAAGRLVPQKGFDVLLDAWSRVGPDHPAWELVVYGEGPDREALEARAADVPSVRLPGITQELPTELARSEIFALPSRFEGFPNVLCEAMAAGAACVATRCPGGPEAIITDGHDGLLVPVEDVGALADALRRLIDDDALRVRLGAAAEEVRERYAPARIVEAWSRVLESVA